MSAGEIDDATGCRAKLNLRWVLPPPHSPFAVGVVWCRSSRLDRTMTSAGSNGRMRMATRPHGMESELSWYGEVFLVPEGHDDYV